MALMNNLDVVMIRQAQMLASKQQGIKYKQANLVPFLRELQGNETGVKQQTLRVILDERTWTAFWKLHQSNRSKTERVPKVDFKKEIVLAAALPQSVKQGISICEVVDSGGKRVVTYAITPARDLSSSFHFVVIGRTNKPVVWQKAL